MDERKELWAFLPEVYARYSNGKNSKYREWIAPYKGRPEDLVQKAIEALKGDADLSYAAVVTKPKNSISWKGVHGKPSLQNFNLQTEGRPVLLLTPQVFLAQRYLLAELKEQIGQTFENLESVLGVSSENSVSNPYRSDIRKAVIRIGKIRRNNPRACFLKSDISKFYPSINLDLLRGYLLELGLASNLVESCFNFLERPVFPEDPSLSPSMLEELRKFEIGVPLGLVISPFLANLYLYDVDREFEPVNYYRYVDDLLFWADSESEVIRSWKAYRLKLRCKGLRVHPLTPKKRSIVHSKTRLVSRGEHLPFLGLSVSNQGAVHPQLEKFLIFEYKAREILSKEVGLLKRLAKLENLVAGFAGYYGNLISERDARRLDDVIAACVKQSLVEAEIRVRGRSNEDLVKTSGVRLFSQRRQDELSKVRFFSDANSSSEDDEYFESIIDDSDWIAYGPKDSSE